MRDVAEAVAKTREVAAAAGMSTFQATRLATASSELARNAVVHGGGGSLDIETVDVPRQGVRITVTDAGPGIADVARALRDGFSSSGSMGHGLGGAQRLLGALEIDSRPGCTRVRGTLWRH